MSDDEKAAVPPKLNELAEAEAEAEAVRKAKSRVVHGLAARAMQGLLAGGYCTVVTGEMRRIDIRQLRIVAYEVANEMMVPILEEAPDGLQR